VQRQRHSQILQENAKRTYQLDLASSMQHVTRLAYTAFYFEATEELPLRRFSTSRVAA
jgi:hypothetical protein